MLCRSLRRYLLLSKEATGKLRHFIFFGIIMENIFNLPGLGRLMLTALSARDYPVISGINLFFAAGVVAINLVIDLIYGYLDPRVRYG